MMKKRIIIAAIVLFATGGVNFFIQTRAAGMAHPTKSSLVIPYSFKSWEGAPYPLKMPEYAKPGFLFSRVYKSSGRHSVNLMVMYSRRDIAGSMYHQPSLCYTGAGWIVTQSLVVSSDSGKISMTGFLGKMGKHEILVFHGFYQGGRIFPFGLERKIFEMKEKLAKGYSRVFFVEAALFMAEGEKEQGMAAIKKFLNNIESDLLAAQ